jgi:hypothetical protein
MKPALYIRPALLLAIGAVLSGLGYFLAFDPILLAGMGALACAWGWFAWEIQDGHPIIALLFVGVPVYYIAQALGGGVITEPLGWWFFFASIAIIIAGYLSRGTFRMVRAMLDLPYKVY